MSAKHSVILPRRVPPRMSTQRLLTNMGKSSGVIGKYLATLKKQLFDIDGISGQKPIFSSSLYLLNWLNTNTNIDYGGLQEILNGAYTIIEGDNSGNFNLRGTKSNLVGFLGKFR